MARTKQTARKATGGMAPRKVAAKLKKAAKNSAAEPTPAMPPTVATTPNSSDDEAESKKRTPQNGTPGDKESAASPVQPKPILVGASDDDGREQGAAGAGVSRGAETKAESANDGEEVVELGWVSASATIRQTPAAPGYSGTWGPAEITYDPHTNGLSDSNGVYLGSFIYQFLPSAIRSLSQDRANTQFNYRIQLEPRTKLDGEYFATWDDGSKHYDDSKIRISFSAARMSVASIRDELLKRKIPLQAPTGTYSERTREVAIAGPFRAPDASEIVDLTKDEPEPAAQEPPRLMVNLTPTAARNRALAERSAKNATAMAEITGEEEAGVSPQNNDDALTLANDGTMEPVASSREFEQQTSKGRADFRLEQGEEMELPHSTKAQFLAVAAHQGGFDASSRENGEEAAGARSTFTHSSSPALARFSRIMFLPRHKDVGNTSQTPTLTAATEEAQSIPLAISPSASRGIDEVMENASQSAATASVDALPVSTVMPPQALEVDDEVMEDVSQAAATVTGETRSAPLLSSAPTLQVDDEIMKDAFKVAPAATTGPQPASSRPIVTAGTSDEHMKNIPQPPTTATARAPQGDLLGQTAPPQVFPESHQTHQASGNTAVLSTVLDEIKKNIVDFMKITGVTSIEEARQYLTATYGNVQQALERFYKDHKAPVIAKEETPTRPATSPGPLTLLEEALAAHLASQAKPKKERQRRGDTIVILDGADLSRNCRVNHSDLIEASSFFEPDLAGLFRNDDVRDVRDVQGVRYLYILMQADAEMPTLLRKSLSTLWKDCAGEMYTVSTKKDLDCEIMDVITSNHAGPLVLPASNEIAESAKKDATAKPQAAAQPEVGPSEVGIDWQVGYEDFFCIITRFRPKWFDNKNIASVVPKLEAVAHIANLYEAVNLASPVTTSLTDLFNRYIVDKKLWEAILTDAGRWLRLAILLRNVSIYREAFIHVVGCFPEWPWTVQQADIPDEVLERIKIKSCLLLHQRREIERKLLLLTIYEQQLPRTEDNDGLMVPVTPLSQLTAYNTVSLFGDWMRSHLAYLDTGSPVLALPSELCEHAEGVCLTVAGFFFDVHEGRDEYLSEKSVIENWNVDLNFRRPAGGGRIEPEARWQDWVKRSLKILKKEASKLVAPLAKRNLQVGEAVEYLTCVEVEDDDIPWEREVKGEDDGEDDVMD